MDQVLALEALSALTGATVKPHTGFQGGFASATDVQGGFVRDTDVEGGFARATDVEGGFARDIERQGGFARAGIFNELTTDNYLLTVFGLKSGFLPAVQLFTDVTDSFPERELFVNINNFFDPKFDYDFRSGGDSSRCSRGGESYTRPWGWYRYALKVLDEHPDGNNWLGTPGWRNNSSPGEWPVSFHGTNFEGAEGIASSQYKPGSRELYGRGIYSTPDLRVAECYTKTFKSKSDGNTYKVIMQNRINPQMRKITSRSDYWLIPVPAGTSPSEERSIVERSIRPYGILIKQV